VVTRPRLTIRNLRPETPDAEVIRAYRETVEQLGGYARQLEKLLNGYRDGSQADH
jgi:hypothetical protein